MHLKEYDNIEKYKIDLQTLCVHLSTKNFITSNYFSLEIIQLFSFWNHIIFIENKKIKKLIFKYSL